ncbi:universal stress protein [Streptomyces sp. NPDC019531]|uniref:universal stress protein n=1 Tax=Streptomyces sp. NPDC019531 TaxID=3365062 RepID=UPI00384A83A0
MVLADGPSAAARAAAEFTFAEAAQRGVELVVLHTRGRGVGTQVLSKLREEHPDVKVSFRRISGRARRAATEIGARAQLAVVGVRGHTGFVDVLSGSVGRAVLRHASCTVAVVPAGGVRA